MENFVKGKTELPKHDLIQDVISGVFVILDCIVTVDFRGCFDDSRQYFGPLFRTHISNWRSEENDATSSFRDNGR